MPRAARFPEIPRRGQSGIRGPLTRPAWSVHHRRMTTIKFDFSKLPSDVALFLTQQEHTAELARSLSRIMRLDEPERQFIHDEIVGAVAEVVDNYLTHATRPKSDP